ncbi:MAG: hypothetical protein JO257_27720 [Deltaproteobacteria bacterium]|nr:hypothetical protein [Deltaproteobacteria bacterium]
MRKLFAWLGAASLVVLWSVSTHAAPGNALKPYVVLILDTSGSMNNATGSGPPSCGGTDTKLNHARCAINNIVNSYGDIVFAFSKFHMNGGGAINGTCPNGCTLTQDACTRNSDRFQLMSGLVDGNNAEAATWVDFSCNTCSQAAPISGNTNPEVWQTQGNTPIEGSLRGDKCYWQGLDASSTATGCLAAGTGVSLWNTATPGYAPIANDPTNNVFLGAPGCDSSAACTTNCCTSQCRPYITILLTDGDETCGGTTADGTCSTSGALCYLDSDCPAGQTCVGAGTVDQAAASLLQTNVGGKRYRIKTNPIGFGIAPGYAPIERIAHAGGNVDVAGVNEGFYANDEAGLELAISTIIEGSIRTELCNNLDDDCDVAIDEDFPNKGQACDNGELGVCKRNGTFVCKADGTGTVCNAPQITPGSEGTVCNGLDDDCDGLIDEGIQGCQCNPTAEICDGKDQNCNGIPDDGVPPKSCAITNSFGTCPGTQVCAATVGCVGNACYGACTGQTPAAETCDGQDNNCDGVCDGFNQACSNFPVPKSPPGNNLGDASHNPIPQNVCHPGQMNCPSFCGSSNTFGNCTGEVLGCNPSQNPGIHCDVCNGLDDDCDNKIDEDFVPADCSTNCGIGQTQCVNGTLQCNSTAATSDPTCDGIDDDCDGRIDEDWVCDASPTCDPVTNNQCCKCGSGTTCEKRQCVNGAPTCISSQPIDPEQCNCLDDDCDGNIDENTTCGNGGQCVQCQCAFACSPGEFPCPLGKKCDQGFCVNDPCYGVTCGPDGNGNAQVCQPKPNDPTNAECVAACSVTTCQSPLVCVPKTGDCKPNDCTTFPEMCASNQTCVVDINTGNGSCVTNPCAGVTCPSGEYCSGGNCVMSCADVTCPSGQRCRLGVCEADPCGHPCPFGQVCDDSAGMCHPDPCQFRQCPQGDWCNPNDGQCEADPCLGTTCPSPDQVCKGGTCYNPDQFLPDAGIEQHVTVGGGGCNTTGGDATWLVGVALLLVRRRRHGGAQ